MARLEAELIENNEDEKVKRQEQFAPNPILFFLASILLRNYAIFVMHLGEGED